MSRRLALSLFAIAVLLPIRFATAQESPTIVVAEGEQFQVQGKPEDNGWTPTHQDQSYGSHTYGGMWMSQGGCLGAPADSEGSLAVQAVTIPAAGKYRVWSKYQAPPFFNYLHKIEIVQKGKTVFSHTYGKSGTDRLWSFSGQSDELWWPWGIDHDSAEAPKTTATLTAGPAEIRLLTVKNAQPAADRYVDFVLLTTNLEDSYEGFKPYRVGSPFSFEALAATKLYLRFQNRAAEPAQLDVRRAGHFQPNYGSATEKFPAEGVAPGKWSPWVNIGPFCRLVHDEGLWLTLPGATQFEVQIARDAAGKDLVGDMKLASGEAIVVPIDVTWNKNAVVQSSQQHARDLIAASKKWRKAGGGKKPKHVLFYGAFRGAGDWIDDLKNALGYNTQLPERFPGSQWDGLHGHLPNAAKIEAFAESYGDTSKLVFVSFGDEIRLGRIKFDDPANVEKFRKWLKAKGVEKDELGVAPEQAQLTIDGDPRLVWYSNLFNEEERFADFRARTQLVQRKLGKHVLSGANYSPHHLALYYGPVFQWVDIFKHGGMSMHWAEDYIFSVPEAPQIISWQFAEMRCGVKYRGQPIHFYVMPHAPGQKPGFLRRNLLTAVGYGARHIDNFWVGPEENFTENYVSWNYPETFRALSEAIYDTSEAEKLLDGGKLRANRVAVVIGKATDFNESRLMVDKSQDPLARRCKNAPEQLNQILCRKDQQMLYLALLHAQHGVDLITEDDIVERNELRKYDAVYFAGEWIDSRAVEKFDAWVKAGGVLYATAGLGHLDQFNQEHAAMLSLLGLKSAKLTKNAVVIRTLLELPLLEPIDTITLGESKIPAVGMRQSLTPDSAQVLGTWSDGSPAVTVREHGKGKAFAVGTLAGNTYMKTALKQQPWPRGGERHIYNPTEFDPAATKLVRLGVEASRAKPTATTSEPLVETIVTDHPLGTLVTLVNWTNAPIDELAVSLRLPFSPKAARSVAGQKNLAATADKGVVTFKTPLTDADYILLLK
ncbi:MAG: beta-galactosidase trimerization domain-containing protein [Pirellulaceae bacterium]